MDEHTSFINKQCRLTLKNGFVLYGSPLEITPTYVLFKTSQKTSFIGWIDIKELSPDGNQRELNNVD